MLAATRPTDESPDAGLSGIHARGVRRSFGKVAAIAHMDLDAPAGQVTALVGPNGAGKTTLLLVLATLLVPDAGEVSVAGHDPVARPRAVRARMGWMPDSFGSYETLTAREVLEFVAATYQLPRERRAARARELLAMVHLEEYADRAVHVLSRGQKQRLGLARAMVHDPAVLLLDELAAGLDPRSRIELRTLLRELAAGECAVLVSSHILAELEETADRAVFVAGGRTVSVHHVSDLREGKAPRSTWKVREALRRGDLERGAVGDPSIGGPLAGQLDRALVVVRAGERRCRVGLGQQHGRCAQPAAHVGDPGAGLPRAAPGSARP